MEIGVTCVNPETADFPSCAQKLSNGTWVSVNNNTNRLFQSAYCVICVLFNFVDLVWS